MLAFFALCDMQTVCVLNYKSLETEKASYLTLKIMCFVEKKRHLKFGFTSEQQSVKSYKKHGICTDLKAF